MSEAASPAGPWPDLAGRLAGDEHRLAVRVYFEDTDFSGVVYHASYLRFMERGRSDFLRLAGIHHRDLAEGAEALAFAVRAMDIVFHRPARIDDVVEVVTRIRALEGARIILAQSVCLGDVVLVEAGVTAVLVNAAGKPRRLPASLRARLQHAGAPR
jgi:acyl-CoA thioester hydrolase